MPSIEFENFPISAIMITSNEGSAEVHILNRLRYAAAKPTFSIQHSFDSGLVTFQLKMAGDKILELINAPNANEYIHGVSLIDFFSFLKNQLLLGASTKEFTAVIKQEGTEIPEAFVISSSLGEDVTWERTAPGTFLGNCSEAVFTSMDSVPRYGLINAEAQSFYCVQKMSNNSIALLTFTVELIDDEYVVTLQDNLLIDGLGEGIKISFSF